MIVLVLNRCIRQKISDCEDLTALLVKEESRLSGRYAASIGK